MNTTTITPVFTTDKFEQKVNAIADEQRRAARNIKFNWSADSGETRYEWWDYQLALEEAIIIEVRTYRAPDNTRN